MGNKNAPDMLMITNLSIAFSLPMMRQHFVLFSIHFIFVSGPEKNSIFAHTEKRTAYNHINLHIITENTHPCGANSKPQPLHANNKVLVIITIERAS